MERINRPEDDFREKLTRTDIERICSSHGIELPNKIVSEKRGNEKVCYHLDDKFFLAFVICEDIHSNVESLSFFEEIEEIPTPRLIAWVEEDPVLGVPYMITERCPGSRLDSLWNSTTPEERVEVLEAFGAGTACYHTVTARKLKEHAKRLGLSRLAEHIQPHKEVGGIPVDSLPSLSHRLNRIGIDEKGIVKQLEAHFTRCSPVKNSFIEPGLVHGESCAEHFIMQGTDTGFRLSGCVDLGIRVTDPIGEITSHYVSMLSLDQSYYEAFKRGYERFFLFPSDAEERLRIEAIEHDLNSILWLLDTMESRPEWSSATVWVSGHLQRLKVWLDPEKRPSRALFRKDIGPW